MKKIKIKLPAFSLAEALITLLIVCLITLASIPVLTKKKRTISDGSHGTWMCSVNSLGNLVYWSSSDPQGDSKNPDTWQLGCKFTPPVNVSTYNITAIGAGGNGANGESKLELVKAVDRGTAIIRPSTTGLYRIVVVGGGGGGGNGTWRKRYCSSNKCGTGGAGGSGAYIVADVRLIGDKKYTLSPGAGGAAVGGHTGGCHRKYATGEVGGESVFKSSDDDSLYIKALGGNGGSRITCSGKSVCTDNCGGGSGAEALGDITHSINIFHITFNKTIQYLVDGVNKKDDSSVVALGYGHGGQSGGCGKKGANGVEGRQTQGGAGFNLTPFGGGDAEANLGAGGNGSAPDSNYARATAGSNGYVAVYKIIRMQGEGGSAAKAEEKLTMSVKGRIDISVGRPYLKSDNAVKVDGVFDPSVYRAKRTTTVKIMDKNDRVVKTIVSYPGDDGTQFEGEYPTSGENSYWTQDGGGAAAPAYCRSNGKEPVYEGQQDARVVSICTQVKCGFDAGDDETGNEIPSGYCIEGLDGCASPQKMISYYVDTINYSSMTETTMKTYLNKFSQDFFKQFYIDPATGLVDYSSIWTGKDSYFTDKDDDLQGFYNYETEVDGHGPLKDENAKCFSDKTNKMSYAKVCEEGKEQEKTLTAPDAKIIGYRDSYVCTDGSDADKKAYGAGGGGGYAYSVPGFASKGGKGAPGVVIVEW